jgi:hypothetical protein
MKTFVVVLALFLPLPAVTAQTVDSSELGLSFALEAPGFDPESRDRQETWQQIPVADPGQLVPRFENHSDPAGPEIEFAYELAAPAQVRFTIANGSGSLTITTFPGWLAAGRHTKTVATAALDNGVYYAVLEANGLRQTRRFVVQH